MNNLISNKVTVDIFNDCSVQVSMNPTGLVRCIAVAPSGHWVALGQASGFLTILDIRTGLIIASWKGHECEVNIKFMLHIRIIVCYEFTLDSLFRYFSWKL